MNTPAQLQMNAIISDLQTLVPNVLNCVIADDMTKTHPLDRTFPGFPAALVIPPTLKNSEFEDQATNIRSYSWYVMVVTTPGNMPANDPTYLAGLMDNVCAVFDLDCTLQGTANGAVFPATLEAPPLSYNGVTYTMFYLTFVAKQLVPAGHQ